jgi:aryl-alcohol dehydrogenase-like predicted oxidoreductase
MSETPEKIWAWFFLPEKQDDFIKGGWDDAPDRKSTKYTRTDSIPSQDALIRAALDAGANEIDCGKCYGKPCPRPGDCMNVLADEIRALADDPQALAAIRAKAGVRG